MGRVYNVPWTIEQRMSELRRDGWSFLPTAEDWHPTWPGGLVAACLFVSGEGRGGRIVVKGGDDTVMVREFADEDAARRCYVRLPSVVTADGLAYLGFRFD